MRFRNDLEREDVIAGELNVKRNGTLATHQAC